MQQYGTVTLVGAGPGDQGLLTLKGAQKLAQAQVVVYDRLVSADILALIPPKAEQINVGKESSHHLVKQEDINQILLAKALEGKNVVRLKGGDPFVFGRGGEELELLAEHQIPFEVVPGITSAIAALAYAGIPITHRDCCSSLHIITGHAREGGTLAIPFQSLVQLHGTLVFLMGVSALQGLMQGLLDAGMNPNTPAAVVENGTRTNQRKQVATVATLAAVARDAQIHSPAIIAVGDVCSLSEKFEWFGKGDLFGKTVLVTQSQSGKLADLLRTRGASVIDCPCIDCRDRIDNPPLVQAFTQLHTYEWLLFSSKNGVAIFFSHLLAFGLDARALAHLKIGVVGSQTAKELERYALHADCMPTLFDGAHLAQAVLEQSPQGRILLCEAAAASDTLAHTLEQGGAACTRVSLYDTVCPPTPPPAFPAHTLAAFASASAVNGFVQLTGRTDVHAVCIGSQTAAAAKEQGMERVSIASAATLESLADTIAALTA